MANPDTMSGSSCAGRTLYGVGTGVALGVLAAGVIVGWRGPSARASPMQNARQLIGLLAPAGAMVGGLYAFTECTSEVFRNRDDVFNSMVGGCAAGATMGMYRKSMASAALGCLAFGAAGGLADVNKYMYATPDVVAVENKHADDLQTSSETVDAFAAAEFK